jgi:hypothetical protein
LRQSSNLALDRFAVGIGVGAVGGLDCQFADTLQQVAGGAQATFGRLRQRDTVVGVTRSRGIAANLRRETLGNRQTCGVVFGAVDAQTGRQALQRG